MRKVKLFIASSLDGFIAGPNGEIDWLFHDQDYGYKAFAASVDTILMGNKTYRDALQLEENFPRHMNMKIFVFSRREQAAAYDNVEFVTQNIPGLVSKLKDRPGKDLWLMGGGEINALLVNADLIDEMIISYHPVLVGSGVPLFAGDAQIRQFRLQRSQAFDSGLLQVVFTRT